MKDKEEYHLKEIQNQDKILKEVNQEKKTKRKKVKKVKKMKKK